jgi:hypothetical protein
MTARRFALVMLTLAFGLGLAAPAAAQTYVGGNVPTVGATDSGPALVTPVVAGGQGLGVGSVRNAATNTPRSAPVGLALTGGDVLGLVAIGLVLVALGAGVARGSRSSG